MKQWRCLMPREYATRDGQFSIESWLQQPGLICSGATLRVWQKYGMIGVGLQCTKDFVMIALRYAITPAVTRASPDLGFTYRGACTSEDICGRGREIARSAHQLRHNTHHAASGEVGFFTEVVVQQTAGGTPTVQTRR